MTPLRLSHTWSRRLYAVLFMVSLVYVSLYALKALGLLTIAEPLTIDLIAAIGAGAVLIASVVLIFIAKKIDSFVPSFVAYGILLITTAYIVQQSGGTESPFASIWSVAVFFAPLFGALGWLPAFVMIGGYTAGSYLNNELGTGEIIAIVIGSLAPLIAGMIVWRQPSDTDDAANRNAKNLASELSEVATKSEIIINAIGDGVIAVDSKGVIQLINPAAQEILGWGKQDALMLNYKSILKLSDDNNNEIDPSQDPLQQVLNTNQETRGGKLTAISKSGKKLAIAMVVSPIGEVGAGAIAVFRDVTKERAEEREQAEFISTASHEMRTPVASIEGYLGLAINPNTATVDERAKDFINKAHEAAQHLGRLFQDLLDVSKTEDGRMTNMPKVTDIVPFTQTIVQGLQQKAIDKGLRLTFVPTDSGTQKKIMPVYYVNLDNDHIREILDNLIENAIKYTPKGEVTVDISGSDDKVVVSIKDSGLGIPTEDIPHLFQKFYRVSNMDRQEIGGTGLGLYLSRRLVEAMQGRLWVESIFGSGSTFYVELPRITSDQAAALKQQQDLQAAAATQAQPTPAFESVAQTNIQPAPVAPQPPMAQPVITQPAVAQSVPIVVSQPPVQQAPQLTAQPVPQPQQQTQPQPQAQAQAQIPVVRTTAPATTVPRGETLTRDQIAERVRQLEQLAQQQRAEQNSGQGR